MPHIHYVCIINHGIAGIVGIIPKVATRETRKLDRQNTQRGHAELCLGTGTEGNIRIAGCIYNRFRKDNTPTLGRRHDNTCDSLIGNDCSTAK